ncbi:MULTISPECIES: hypothetical protein [unclassified Streptomyces]|uniref:hypothetical protein n=1 Tax=unclassified Streptomyces TaxID=2593676 RepID=UPI0006F5F294|nr:MULTISPECIES: hypothetical protein [unclassified Streptomyces]KQX57782.1 hypothetical protein ASD33_25050 [Streptomyces sp. Root1304]KRA78666.1 hypothetical protein ASE09_22605 [Streptomyces sp. Root66D1]
MTSRRLGVKSPALIAPLLLVLYGLLRLVDGLDGEHGPGLAWNLGHALFFVGFALFGVVTVGLRRLVPATTSRGRLLANAAATAGLFGVACFLWVILGDLFADLDSAAPLPEPLQMIGPLAFQLGWLTLLVMLVAARPRLLPVWSPLLVLVGFVLFAADLDLLPIGGLLLMAGLAPVARMRISRA